MINNLYNYNDPLEQFDVIPLITIFNLSIVNNIVVYFIIIFFAFSVLSSQASLKISNLSNLGFLKKKMFVFVKTIVTENVSLAAQKHFILIYYMFLFLLFCNLIGMVPYSFTITSSLVVSFFLSLGFFLGVNIIGFLVHGINIFSLFLPAGAPSAILPGLVLIEILSYFARVFSLSIRLFANMMSGHTLLKILAGFA